MDSGFSLTLNNLLQVNATVIAGVMILMGIGSTSIRHIVQLGPLSIPTSVIISSILIPFIISAMMILLVSDASFKVPDKKYHQNYNIARYCMIAGFVVLLFILMGIAAFSIVY